MMTSAFHYLNSNHFYLGARMDERYEKRLKIITLMENTSKTQTEIAECVGVTKSCVSKIITRYRETGDLSLQYENCGGSNKKLDERDLRKLRKICGNNPRMSAREIQHELGPRGDSVSLRTVQRGLNQVGCQVRVPKKKPFLTDSHVKKRYEWALDHQEWTIDDWSKVVWSDETAVELRDNCPQFVRFVDGFPTTPEHFSLTTKHPTKVIIWSCFSSRGPGRSHVVECPMNTEWYVEDIIDHRILPQMNEWFPNGEGIFQQDNAPCHVSKRSRERFRDLGIILLDWPPASPDMNPIENLWGIVKKRVLKEKPRTKNQIIATFLQLWHHDEALKMVMQSLIASMPKRVSALVESKGFHTKY